MNETTRFWLVGSTKITLVKLISFMWRWFFLKVSWPTNGEQWVSRLHYVSATSTHVDYDQAKKLILLLVLILRSKARYWLELASSKVLDCEADAFRALALGQSECKFIKRRNKLCMDLHITTDQAKCSNWKQRKMYGNQSTMVIRNNYYGLFYT